MSDGTKTVDLVLEGRRVKGIGLLGAVLTPAGRFLEKFRFGSWLAG